MDNETAVQKFKSLLKEQPDLSPAVSALTVLKEFLDKDTSETIQGLAANMKSVISAFMKVDGTVTSVKSGCELFLRYITLTSLDHSDFKECKKILSERGQLFLDNVNKAHSRISSYTLRLIRDNMNILIHSHSRVVYHALVEAHNAKKYFHVYVTESAPDYSGKLMYEKLKKAGIDCTLIIDAAVSHVMEHINIVLLGADSVVENGGIINKIGTYGLAIAAKTKKKDVYVLAESFKFVRIFPVSQRDLHNEMQLFGIDIGALESSLIDYTPPTFINLLLTDMGILPTSAVSDELIKLYT